MLDLDDPRTPHVFAASSQLDLILDYCKRISLSGADGRRFMLEVIRPAFAALRWLAAHHFADVPHIADAIAKLKRQSDELAELPLRDPAQLGRLPAQCPVWAGMPNSPSEDDMVGYCARCLEVLFSALLQCRSCDADFGCV